jgi:ABC-2 type transport system ATP-binding protein
MEGNMEQLLNTDHEKKIVEFTIESDTFPQELLQPGLPFLISWDPVREKGNVEIKSIDKELPKFFEFLSQRKLKLKNLEFRKKTLDDLFTSLTGRHLHE